MFEPCRKLSSSFITSLLALLPSVRDYSQFKNDVELYHPPICVFADVIPEKVFVLAQRLMYAEIINYKTDSSFNWLAVTGLLAQVIKTLLLLNFMKLVIPLHVLYFMKKVIF